MKKDFHKLNTEYIYKEYIGGFCLYCKDPSTRINDNNTIFM